MGTRGIWGFRKDGIDKVSYKQFDCYPDGLGKDFFRFLKLNDPDKLSAFFEKMIVIDNSIPPTDEQKACCKKMGWYDDSVSMRTDTDWYCLLRGLQEPDIFQDAIDDDKTVYIDNYIHFIKDSLMCEYGYIFDLNTLELEFYEGIQREPSEGNRYGTEKDDASYYPCKLICTFSYDLIKTIGLNKLVDLIHMAEEHMRYEEDLEDNPDLENENKQGVFLFKKRDTFSSRN